MSEATALPEAAHHLRDLVSSFEKRGDALSKQLEDRFERLEEVFNERARALLQETGKGMSETSAGRRSQLRVGVLV